MLIWGVDSQPSGWDGARYSSASNSTSTVNGVHNDVSIANGFAKYFASVYYSSDVHFQNWLGSLLKKCSYSLSLNLFSNLSIACKRTGCFNTEYYFACFWTTCISPHHDPKHGLLFKIIKSGSRLIISPWPFDGQWEIMNLEPLLKEGSEFELRRESDSWFHSLGAETWNARETVTVLHCGSAKRPVVDDRKQRGGM